jgi:hypothetical protein
MSGPYIKANGTRAQAGRAKDMEGGPAGQL